MICSGDGKSPAAQKDDGELGGMGIGMEVWDDYERELKVWEAEEAAQEADASGSGGSPVAGTS